MRQNILLSIVVALLFTIVSCAFAGLIDPSKPRKTGVSVYKKDSTSQRPVVQTSETAPPAWLKTEPKVTTNTEKSYDINRDGKLQSPEVKIFLRDAIDEATQKGGYRIDSPILKEYDKNGDGVISKYEAEEISKFVR